MYIKIKKILLIIALFFIVSAQANPNFVVSSGIHIDQQGKLIPPDKIFLAYAYEGYEKGYYQSSFSYFKKAAALGNSVAQKYIGLMHLKSLGVEKDWAKGYAWIKLAAMDKNKDHEALERKIYKLLTPIEIERAEKEYLAINEEYGQIATLTRRDRWAHKQKLKMTGSRTGSGVFVPLSASTPHGNGLLDGLKSYVDDFNYGHVSPGEIIPKEEPE